MCMQGVFLSAKTIQAAKNGRTGAPLYSDAIAARRWVDSLKVEDVDSKRPWIKEASLTVMFISFSAKDDINPPRVVRWGSCEPRNGARPSKGVGKSWSAPARGTKRDREESPDAEAPWGDPGWSGRTHQVRSWMRLTYIDIYISWKGCNMRKSLHISPSICGYQPIIEEIVIWWCVRWVLNGSVARKVWSYWKGL